MTGLIPGTGTYGDATDPYTVAIDLGTARTAAAVWRRGGPATAIDLGGSTGGRGATIPSVVYADADGTMLIGEPAVRRGLTDPTGVAREFKRRTGDPTPLLLRGVPWSVAALTSRLLRGVMDLVVAREGADAEHIVLTHPANWGPYKLDVLAEAAALADLRVDRFVPEPEAAAIHYARQTRVPVGATIAVYDLGGGTFDVAVLRKAERGFELVGAPEGLDALGGSDVDVAVFQRVTAALGASFIELDRRDAATSSAVARLRQACVEAKEALSADAEAAVPVSLPSLSTEVRFTRTELEALVEPMLGATIGALRRALRTAGVDSSELHAVLLTGGAARMPLVARLVSNEFGRPIAIDIDPKLAVALGAATVFEPAAPMGARPASVTTSAVLEAPTSSTSTIAPVRTSARRVKLVAVAGLGLAVLGGTWWLASGERDDDRVDAAGRSTLAGSNTDASASVTTISGTAAGTPASTDTVEVDSTSSGVANDPPAVDPATPTPTGAATNDTTIASPAAGGAVPVPVSPITGRGVQIVEIVRDEVLGTYEVRLRVAGFSWEDGDHVVHLFGNDVRPEQAGADATERGVERGAFVPAVYQSPWEFRTEEISAAATRLCAVVADADGTLDDPSTFDCRDLPRAAGS